MPKLKNNDLCLIYGNPVSDGQCKCSQVCQDIGCKGVGETLFRHA